MLSLSRVLRASVLTLAAGLSGAQSEERQFSEYENLNEAILAARATLDLFWQVAALQPCGCSGAVLAVRLPWEGRVVDVDVIEPRRIAPGQSEGRVRYADVMVVPELADMVVTFTDDDVVDWGFGRDGRWYGLFQFKAIQAGATVIPADVLEADTREAFKKISLP